MNTTLDKFEGKAYQGGASMFHGVAAKLDQGRTPFIVSDLSTIKYSIRNMSTNEFTKSEVELAVEDVISDTLDNWLKNFHVPFPDDCFPDAVSYEVTFEFTASDDDSTKTYGKGIIRVEPITLPDP
jgi:hypothetical protein